MRFAIYSFLLGSSFWITGGLGLTGTCYVPEPGQPGRYGICEVCVLVKVLLDEGNTDILARHRGHRLMVSHILFVHHASLTPRAPQVGDFAHSTRKLGRHLVTGKVPVAARGTKLGGASCAEAQHDSSYREQMCDDSITRTS
jgi:hypothetical protein